MSAFGQQRRHVTERCRLCRDSEIGRGTIRSPAPEQMTQVRRVLGDLGAGGSFNVSNNAGRLTTARPEASNAGVVGGRNKRWADSIALKSRVVIDLPMRRGQSYHAATNS